MRVPTNAQVCMFIKLVLFLISLYDAKQSLITFKNEENSKNIFEYFWITVNFARDIKTLKQNDRDLNKDKKNTPNPFIRLHSWKMQSSWRHWSMYCYHGWGSPCLSNSRIISLIYSFLTWFANIRLQEKSSYYLLRISFGIVAKTSYGKRKRSNKWCSIYEYQYQIGYLVSGNSYDIGNGIRLT